MQKSTAQPWFKNGLRFECTMCGHCCTGAPGFVWINDQDVSAIAQVLDRTREQFLANFTREVGDKRSLVERPDGDCVFYDRTKGCTIYDVRPGQCRTWPFWDSNLATPESWQHTCEVCPGSGKGKLISVEEIVRRMKVMKI